MRIQYIASRRLAPGHRADSEYEIVVLAQTLDRQISASISRQISLDRQKIESELRGIDSFYDVLTDHIAIGQDSAEFEEFLASVINAETFTFDPDSDDSGIEVNPMTAILETTNISPQRNIPGYYQYSFTVRIL